MSWVPGSGPAASGARLAGDDYQHLLTWLYAVQLLRKRPDVIKVELEKHDAGNVDDLVVHRTERPPEYHQIKFSTRPGDPLTGDWFLQTGGSKKSPLARFYESWQKLAAGDQRPHMVLHTNRMPADGDRLLGCLSGDRARFVPRLAQAGANTQVGQIRAAWAEHLGIDEAELLEMLASLEIRAARQSLIELRDQCRLAMDSAGLQATAEAVDQGQLAVRRWIQEGVRLLVADTVGQLVDEGALRSEEPRAIVLIQALTQDPVPELADIAIDWVACFEGDQPGARRRTTSPDIWNGRFASDLALAEQRIRALGYSRVRLNGAFRLTTAVAAGATFSDTAGYTLALSGRSADGEWLDVTTEGDRSPFSIETVESAVGAGKGLAVGLSVSADVTDDVMAFLESANIAVDRFVNLRVEDPSRTALQGPEAMRGWASAATDVLRDLGRAKADAVHLFMSVPRPVAMLIGHQWNRMPTTQLWEEATPGQYFPSFTLGS